MYQDFKMKAFMIVASIYLILSSVYAEEDSTSPPYSYGGSQQGGSRLYPSLNGVTDYGNRNNYNYGPGQTSNYNPTNPQGNRNYQYPTGYNMSYPNAGYGSNSYNSSQHNYPNTGYRPGTNPHQPFGSSNPISNPHQPFGTPGGAMGNPYYNNTRPYNPGNTNRYPANPTNQNNPSYPTNLSYPNNNYLTNPHTSGSRYPYNPNYPQNTGHQTQPSGYGSNPTSIYPNNPGVGGYRNNSTSHNYPRQPATNNDPHRPFGQAPKSGSSNNYYKH